MVHAGGVGQQDSKVQQQGLDSSRAWVALQVLTQAPFQLSFGDIIALYVEMLVHIQTWMQDVRATLPAHSLTLPKEETEDVRIHLTEVVLCVLSQWVEEIEARGGRDVQALAQ